MQFLQYVFPAVLALYAVTPGPDLPVSNSDVLENKTSLLIDDSVSVNLKRVATKAYEAKKFVRNKGYNESIVFLIDMTLPSSRNRFFIYDLKKDSVLASALVSHGICFGSGNDVQFSNIVGSGCSSLGKYKIGKPYVGQWGYSYKLHGLDESNNKAYERTVVLHSHSSIPDFETGDEIARSLGCPMVSSNFLLKLKKIINNSSKPVLLWIYQ